MVSVRVVIWQKKNSNNVRKWETRKFFILKIWNIPRGERVQRHVACVMLLLSELWAHSYHYSCTDLSVSSTCVPSCKLGKYSFAVFVQAVSQLSVSNCICSHTYFCCSVLMISAFVVWAAIVYIPAVVLMTELFVLIFAFVCISIRFVGSPCFCSYIDKGKRVRQQWRPF